MDSGQIASRASKRRGEEIDGDGTESLTGGRELCIHPLAHDPLQSHTRTHEADRDERQRVRPRGVAAHFRDTPLPALPCGEGGGHGEERLDEGPEEEPRACLRAHLVTYAPDGGAGDEGEDRGERLLICEVEGGIALSWGAGEEARKGEGELDGVSGLETTPDEDGSEGY